MVGTISIALLAWLMLGISNCGWRWFAAVSSIPALAAFLMTYYFLPESPRFLLKKGRVDDCVHSLRSFSLIDITDAMFQVKDADKFADSSLNFNGLNFSPLHTPDVLNSNPCSSTNELYSSSTNELYSSVSKGDGQSQQTSIINKDIVPLVTESSEDCNDNISGASAVQVPSKSVEEMECRAEEQYDSLLSAPAAVKTLLMRLSLIWFSLSFGSYGIAMWIATLFDNIGLADVYAATFIVALANLPGNIVSICYIEEVGRCRILQIGMIFAAISAAGFGLGDKYPVVVIICAALFNAFSTAGWNSLDCLSVEVFPVRLRTSGMGLVIIHAKYLYCH